MNLRTCRDCGLDAHTTEDLESFKKDKNALHGGSNLCKKCAVKRGTERINTDMRYNLRLRFGSMLQRCLNPQNESYPDYGGRGVLIYREWVEDPNSFIDWALEHGFKQELTIDRINTDGNHEPSNIRFVSLSENCKNRRPR